ncbi:hypothetical protein FAES_2909 [Fibrella aestuarina BUZ 2]|uniref:Uncharacterized protein n=1 Tax=Fibrella aestuarina BUZ 2 TaxID=1166018 RepID=I0K9W5_9BACT|nr:hypothetical protein [Fibrella aestuarina]CCH00918.1 hypothetical protein FAES_2909 [Fibrella aestuarina BUZ 2]
MRFLFFLCCLTQQLIPGFGQTARPDTAFRHDAIQFALQRAERADSTTDGLFNGVQYISHDRRLRGHAYFGTDSAVRGRVEAGGKSYTLPIHYDLVDDALVADHRAGYWMVPRGETIQSFHLLNHTFIRLTDTTQSRLPAGYYDLLYDGPSRLLARHTKKILIGSVPNNFGEYLLTTTYYVYRQGEYVKVGSRKALVKLLADRRKELTAYAREQKARFKEDPELALQALAQRYDELNKPQ